MCKKKHKSVVCKLSIQNKNTIIDKKPLIKNDVKFVLK